MMSDECAQGIMAHLACHLPHAPSVRPWLFAAYAKNTRTLCAQMAMRVDGDLTQVRKIARLHQQTTESQHVQPLRNRLGHARALDDHIGTSPWVKPRTNASLSG